MFELFLGFGGLRPPKPRKASSESGKKLQNKLEITLKNSKQVHIDL
jgi:hypothetical protein